MGRRTRAVALSCLCVALQAKAIQTYPIVTDSGVVTNVAGTNVPSGAKSYYFDGSGHPRFIYSDGGIFGSSFTTPHPAPSGTSTADPAPGFQPLVSPWGNPIIAFNGVPVPPGATGYRYNSAGQVEFSYGPSASAPPSSPPLPPAGGEEIPPTTPHPPMPSVEDPPAGTPPAGRDHARDRDDISPPAGKPRPITPSSSEKPPAPLGSLSAAFIPRRDTFNPTADPKLKSADFSKMTGFGGLVVPTELAVMDDEDLKNRKFKPLADGEGNVMAQKCTFTLVDTWQVEGVDHCAYLTGGHCMPPTYSADQPVQIVDSKTTGRTVMAFSRHPDFKNEKVSETRGTHTATGDRTENDIALGFSSGAVCAQAAKNTAKMEMCEELPGERREEIDLRIANSATSENLELESVYTHVEGKNIYDRKGQVSGTLASKDAGKVVGGSSGGAAFRKTSGQPDCVFGVVINVATTRTVVGKKVISTTEKITLQSGEAFRWAKSELAKVKAQSTGKHVATR